MVECSYFDVYPIFNGKPMQIKKMGAAWTFRLDGMRRCEQQRSECVAACQDYEQVYHNRKSWHNPIAAVLKKLQLILPCHQLLENVCV